MFRWLFRKDLPGGDSGVRQHQWYRLTLFVALLFFFFGFYSYSQLKTSRWIYWFDDWVFYADSKASYSDMKEISFEGNMQKHPLYSVMVHPLFAVMKTVFGLGTRQAAKAVIALIGALNVSLIFLLFSFCIHEKTTALVFTGIYGVLFSNLVFFSIPETYSLTNLGIVVFFILAATFHKKISTHRAVVLGIAAGVGALLNPPLGLMLFSVYALCGRQNAFRRSLVLSLWATLATLFVYLGANFFLFGFDFIEHSRKLAGRWASFSNFLYPENWLNVGISFFAYSVISPLKELERSIGLGDMAGYFRSPVTAVAFLLFSFYLGYIALRMIRRLNDILIIAAAAWLAASYLFYVYFNPGEAFLYSCQALAPYLLILARVFQDISWKWKTAPLTLFFVGVTYVNFKCFQG